MHHRFSSYRAFATLELALSTLALCALVGSSSARADVPPPDACTSVGQACGTSASCTCKVSTCTRSIPCSACRPNECHSGSPGDQDGGPGSGICQAQYACNRCRSANDASCPTGGRGGTGRAGQGGVTSQGGAAGHGGGAPEGGAAPRSGSGGAGPGGDDHESGCSCSSTPHDQRAASWLTLGALVYWLARRRRTLA